jgi:hypothetical protein
MKIKIVSAILAVLTFLTVALIIRNKMAMGFVLTGVYAAGITMGLLSGRDQG